MGFRDKVETNTPRVALDATVTLVAGNFKSGKTRLWKEVTELHYPNEPDAALLIAWERGYETWHIKNVIKLAELFTTEVERWAYFRKEIVPGLVQEAKSGKRITKLIGTDTVDKCIDACTSWVIDLMNKKYGKTFSSLQDITKQTNGADNGWLLLGDELNKQFDALQSIGYGLFHLAWIKEKTTTLPDGNMYNSMELMMNNTARKVFESQARFTCCLYNDVVPIDKDGNVLDENKKNKKGDDIATNFHEMQVNMYFRPSQYISIAGGSFVTLPDKVPYSAENFLQVFKDAVIGQLPDPTKYQEIEQQQAIQREEKTQEFLETEQEVTEITPEELIKQIDEVVANMRANATKDQQTKAAGIIKDTMKGVNYKKCADVIKLQDCVTQLNSL